MRTVLAPLPYDSGGFVIEDEDGSCAIVLNSRHTRERNIETCLHDIARGDLHASEAADIIERLRHRR